ncbi:MULTISPECIES: tetratricopeptide repeat protein [Streptomyces]|uniref:tetratricopeptide repeat protein n=1 Tax=Streptomyces TaxID=1883 RepID=UPI00030F9763|nr:MULTISPECIES: tetratricopeptide repeat protein [Streptomyces]MYS92378.1 hypothetical protein [Streptomyces sp. SID5464]
MNDTAETGAEGEPAAPGNGTATAVQLGPRAAYAGGDQHLVVTGDRNRITINGAVPRSYRPRVPRSTYELEVRALEAAGFEGREAELEAMARFATGGTPSAMGYWRWLAPAWAGKTVLMARFYLHPPAGVDVLGFFITSRMAGRADRTAFLAALQRQLQAYLQDADLDCGGYDGFQDALQLAAAQARAAKRHLVLLVDGLDEDTGVTSGSSGYSIAALLPRTPPPGLRIIVAGRPSPPVPGDVPDGHPLRATSIDHALAASPAARAVRRDAERNLDALITGGGLPQDLVGMIAASGGGLSAVDLARLTGQTTRRIELQLGGAVGRVFQDRPAQWAVAPDGRPVRLYSFAHQELLTGARNLLDRADLNRCLDRIHAYVDEARRQKWPPTTAEFSLISYPRMLLEQRDTVRLSELGTDSDRQERLWKTTGTDTEALTEIRDALSLHRAEPEPDLRACVRLAWHKKRLQEKAAATSQEVVLAWAALGFVSKAVALAGLCGDQWRVGEVFEGILRSEHGVRHIDLILAAAGELPGAELQARARAACVGALTRVGRLEEALDVAHSLTDLVTQVSALVSIAGELTDAGRGEEAVVICREALEVAGPITADGPQVSALSAFARALARAGRIPELLEVARSDIATSHASMLGAVAGALASAGRLEEAFAVARSHAAAFQACALASIAEALARAGRAEQALIALERARGVAPGTGTFAWEQTAPPAVAEVLAGAGRGTEALRVAHYITDPGPRASALATVAAALARRGQPEQARSALHQAEETVRTITSPGAQAVALGSIAPAMTAAGRTEEALRVAHSVPDPGPRASALATVAAALARTGQPDQARSALHQAEETVRTITQPERRVSQVVAVARVLTDADRAEDAVDVLREAVETARSITYPPSQGSALTNIAGAIARADRVEEALAVAQSVTDRVSKASALAVITNEIARTGQLEEALNLARSITDPSILPTALGEVARAMARAGRAEEGMEVARAITSPETRVRVLSAIAGVMAHSGRADQALAVFHEAEEETRSITNSTRRVLALSEVAEELAHAGQAERAASVLHRAEQVVYATDSVERHTMVGALAEAMALAGRAEEALALATSITDPGLRAYQIALVAMYLAPIKGEEAVRAARSVSDPSLQPTALGAVAESFAQAGRPEDALRVGRTIPDPATRASLEATAAKALARAGEAEDALRVARSITDPALRASALGAVAEAKGSTAEGRSLLAEALGDGDVVELVPTFPAVAPEALDETVRFLRVTP